jgi:tetratricopeptide (TPR) repeat protein
VAALTAEGWDSWRTGLPEPAAAGVAAMTRATGLDPMDAGAWGLLALLQRASLDYAAPAEMDRTRFAAERAARRALAIDPRQGEALAALAGLHPMFGDWQGSWKRLSDVLRVAPGEVAARTDLGLLEMSTGRPSAALAISKSLVREDPLAAVHQHMLVYRLWSNGRLREMDLAADRALAQWPLHPAIWFARMWTYGYTGRTEAARQLLADAETRPDMPQAQVELLDRTMAALGSGTDVASAVEMNLALARRAPGAAVMAVQHLAALGAIEQAFDVAFGYLVRQGPEVGLLRHRDSASVSLNEQHHRKTMMLFIPATAPLRRDARFATLCREIGLEAFWRARGVVPDFRKAGAPA